MYRSVENWQFSTYSTVSVMIICIEVESLVFIKISKFQAAYYKTYPVR
jgi:hypothetical protein